MDIKPMLSMDVIKKYVDNIDRFKNTGFSLESLHKQRMTQEEVEKYIENLKIIEEKLGKFEESKGGSGGIIRSKACHDEGNNYKLYINPGPEIAKLVIPFMKKCDEDKLPVCLKIMDRGEIQAAGTSDVVNIYTNNPENIKKAYEILSQVVKENNISLKRKTKEFSISLDQNDTIGLGCDRCITEHSWSSQMSGILEEKIKEYFEENGELTSDEIIKLKEESPEKYAKFCEKLYKILNEECVFQSKKIVGLQEIIEDNPSKLLNGNIKNETLDILSKRKVQINGLIGDMYYNQNRKLYIIQYEDGRKGFYQPEIISDAINRGEIIYNRQEVKKADPINKKQYEQSVTREGMNLPEGAEWKLNSNGKYILKITNDDGSKAIYSAEVASKKFGVKVPNQEQTNQIPEGAEWKLYPNGRYMLLIKEKNGSRTYSVEQAIRTYGVKPPNYKNPQSETKLPITKDTKKSVENIARTGLSRDVQSTSSEIKEGYKELENSTHALEENKSMDE